MDIPLHPVVAAEMARGRDLLDRVRAAREHLAAARITVNFPDGPGSITLDGEGMVIAADFPEDIFTRYPASTDLSDVLTAMCQEGYQQLTQVADHACRTALAAESGTR